MIEEIDFFEMAKVLKSDTIRQKFPETNGNPRETDGNQMETSVNPPQSDKMDIEKAKAELDKPIMKSLKTRAEYFIVENLEDAGEALHMRTQASNFSKQIEKTRKEIVRPYIDYQKDIKKFADGLREQFDLIAQNLEGKIDHFRNGKEKVMKIDNESGSVKDVEQVKFDINDASIVPREYLIIDDRAIKAAIKDGIRSIPGVNIYIEKVKKYTSKPNKRTKK